MIGITESFISFILNFPSTFLDWLLSLSFAEIFAITWFAMVIDISRNIVKAIILGADSIHRHLVPIEFDETYQPKLSILVPAHNEAAAIRKTIASILENPYRNKEVIVIDDHSTDNTYDQAYSYYERGLIKLVKRNQGKGSKSAAINYGAVFATGDYIVVMDADTLIERNALHEIAKSLSAPGVTAVSGNVRILAGDGGITNILTKLQYYEYLMAFELGKRYNSILSMLLIVPGAFGVFPNTLSKKVGFYDRDTLGEDFDLTLKLLKTKGKITFAPKAIAWTYCPNNWKAWIRQRVRWSHGQIATLLKHQDILRGYTYRRRFVIAIYDMIFADVILLFLRMAGFVWLALAFSHEIYFIYTLIILLYFASETIAVITAALFSSRRNDLKYLYLMPIVILFYRPFYSYVRLYAYLKRILKRKAEW
jgi:cellulose synthase/poly-beta-1,6-N-acetylglucosamine synthase-like glycosyltransferase